MNIIEFLHSHELISIGSIEKKLGLTKGTIRMNRTIPEKYIKAIESILVDYGYGASMVGVHSTVITSAIELVKESDGVVTSHVMMKKGKDIVNREKKVKVIKIDEGAAENSEEVKNDDGDQMSAEVKREVLPSRWERYQQSLKNNSIKE